MALRQYWDPYVEHCGIVLFDGTTLEIRNSAMSGNEFVMTGEDVCDALVPHGMDVEHIVGIFHTHPSNNMNPSDTDIVGWPKGPEGNPIRYFIITNTFVTEWIKNDDGTVRRTA